MNQTPRVSWPLPAPWSARAHAVARETHGRVCPLCYLLRVRGALRLYNTLTHILALKRETLPHGDTGKGVSRRVERRHA